MPPLMAQAGEYMGYLHQELDVKPERISRPQRMGKVNLLLGVVSPFELGFRLYLSGQQGFNPDIAPLPGGGQDEFTVTHPPLLLGK